MTGNDEAIDRAIDQIVLKYEGRRRQYGHNRRETKRQAMREAVEPMVAGWRERVRDAEQRAERAEAENARLRDTLEQVNTAVTAGYSAKDILMQIVLPALATPPEGGKCPKCGGRGRTDATGTGCICKEQQPEDALAALDEVDLPCDIGVPINGIIQKGCKLRTLLIALERRGMSTAPRDALHQRVPYVPEEVRRLPEEMREQARTVHEADEYNEDGAAGWADASNTWADELERALASAPAVPDGWQEIETAPKDGSLVDLWNHNGRQPDCKWSERKDCWVQMALDGFGRMDWCPIDWPATHWMPLPAAPTKGGNDNG